MKKRFIFSAQDRAFYKNFIKNMDVEPVLDLGLKNIVLLYDGKVPKSKTKEQHIRDIEKDEYQSEIDTLNEPDMELYYSNPDNIVLEDFLIPTEDLVAQAKRSVYSYNEYIGTEDEIVLKKQQVMDVEMIHALFGVEENCFSEINLPSLGIESKKPTFINGEFRKSYARKMKIMERDIKDAKSFEGAVFHKMNLPKTKKESQKNKFHKLTEKLKKFYNKRALHKEEPLFRQELVERMQFLAGIKVKPKEPKRSLGYKFRVSIFKGISTIAWAIHPDAKVKIAVAKPVKPKFLTPELEFMWQAQEIENKWKSKAS